MLHIIWRKFLLALSWFKKLINFYDKAFDTFPIPCILTKIFMGGFKINHFTKSKLSFC